MKQTINVKGSASETGNGEVFKQQLAAHLEKQPASRLRFHKWMSRLEIACVVLTISVFILALYVSITWRSFEAELIASAWFLFAASFGPLLIISGIHSLILGVFPTGFFPGNSHRLVTSHEAKWIGWGLILAGLAVPAFWATFAYATWTENWAVLTPLISIMGIGMTALIIIAMAQKVIKNLK